MGATRHLPLPAFTPVSMFAGIQAPMTRLAMLPSFMPLNHASLQDSTGATSFLLSICCQVVVNFCAPASPKFTETFVPSTLYGRPPACQIRLVVNPGSPTSLVRYFLGSAACSFSAAWTYSSQVVGTAILYLSKTSLL